MKPPAKHMQPSSGKAFPAASQRPQPRHVQPKDLQPGHNRRGSVVVWSALAIVPLLGCAALAVDLGRAAVTRNAVQRACDAGALAGAQELPEDTNKARTVAVATLTKNASVDPSNVTVSFSDTDSNPATTADANTKIIVRAQTSLRYSFAPILKIFGHQVYGGATAIVTPVGGAPANGVPDLVPIGITPGTYAAHRIGQLFTIDLIRQNKQFLGLDDFVLMDLRDQSGKSPSQMEDQVREGWPSDIKINDTETTINADNTAQMSHFLSGMGDRLTTAQQAPWNDFGNQYPNVNLSSPRVMTLLITPENQPVNGTNEAPVKGFAPVYVQSLSADGSQLMLRFLPPFILSDNNTTVPNGTPLSGVRTIRLID